MRNNEKFKVIYLPPPMYPSFVESCVDSDEITLLDLDPSASPEQLQAMLADVRGYYVRASRDELPAAWRADDRLFRWMPNLAVVASYGAGYDTINTEHCTRRGILVVNQAGGNAQGVAEHAIAMMMSLLKRITEANLLIRSGQVAQREALMGRELKGRTIGIVGLGNVGTRVAELGAALQCPVLAYDPLLSDVQCLQRGARQVTLVELLQAADIVTLHCPLNDQTRRLFDAEKFSAMRPGALFINTARGDTYDEDALAAALKASHLAGAGLDVWEHEPPSVDHPLLALNNVLATPHIAGVTHESRDRVARLAAQAFIDVAQGRLPQRIINDAAIAAFGQRFEIPAR